MSGIWYVSIYWSGPQDVENENVFVACVGVQDDVHSFCRIKILAGLLATHFPNPQTLPFVTNLRASELDPLTSDLLTSFLLIIQLPYK